MLSRTADHMFWMSRYTERAENTARILDVNYQTSLLPQSSVRSAGWLGRLARHQRAHAGLQKKYGKEITQPQRARLHGARRNQSVEHCLLLARCA